MERPDVREDADRSGSGPVAGSNSGNPDDLALEAMARIRDRAETVRRRELDEAVGRLEARGSLTDEQRAVLATATERLVDRLLAPAEQGLRAAEAADDPETARAVRRLFED